MQVSCTCSQFQLFRFAMESVCCYLTLPYIGTISVGMNVSLYGRPWITYGETVLGSKSFQSLFLSLVPVDRSEV